MSRHKSIIHGSVSGIVARILNAGSVLLTLPLTLNYLGAETYGVWIAIISLGTIVSTGDFGIGHCLANDSSKSLRKFDIDLTSDEIGSGFLALYLSGTSIALIGIVSYVFPEVSGFIFSNDVIAAQNAGQGVSVLLIIVGLTIGISPYSALLRGAMKVHIINYSRISGTIVSVALLLLAIHQRAPVSILVGCFMLSGLIGNVVCLIYSKLFFKVKIHPRITLKEFQRIPYYIKRGIKFQGVQFLGIGKDAIPIILINRFAAGTTAAEIGIVFRVMGFLNTVIGAFAVPLWSAFKNALDSKDRDWCVSIIRGYTLLILLMAVSFVLLVTIFAPVWLEVWLSNAIQISQVIIFSIGIASAVLASAAPLVMLLNALESFSVQYQYGVTLLIVNCSLALTINWLGLEIYSLIFSILNILVFTRIFYPTFKDLSTGKTFETI